MISNRRLPARAVAGAVLVVVAAAVLTAQQTPQRQVFRGGANFVLVDAYPMRGDRIVEGLTAADFQVLEDGKPQKIEAFEFVRADDQYAIADRKDPNSQREVLVAAADPHNRVLVVFLDISHVTVDGSHAIRAPLLEGLNRMVSPNDLFGVITPFQRAKDLVLGRLLTSLDEQLSKYWTWGERNSLTSSRPADPREMMLSNCFHEKILPPPTGPIDWIVDDGPVRRFFDEALIERLREDVALTALEQLVDHLGTLREARTVLIAVTDGWVLFGPNRVWESEPVGDVRLGSVQSPKNALRPISAGEAIDFQKCLTEMNRLVGFQHEKRLRDLTERANRRNVSFYPVAPSRLAVFDGGGASEKVRLNPKAPPSESVLGRDTNRLRNRQEGLRTLAENTDGLAIVSTNDLATGFRRIVDDVSAYYLIGYSSTNGAQDGRYRRIEVKTNTPNVRMRARRGYTAAGATSAVAGSATAPDAVPVGDALGTLSRFQPNAEVFLAASASASEVLAVIELNAAAVLRGVWAKGAAITVDVTSTKGEPAGTATAKIEVPASSALVRVPVASGGPWRVRARVTGAIDGPVEERLEVSVDTGVLIGPTVMYRALPAPAAPVTAAANQQYRRTERVHLQWAVTGTIERREGRLVGKNGLPLPVPVRFTDREVNGRPGLAADVNLAPLSAGEYVIEITVGRGDVTEKKLIAIRVMQ